MSPNDVKITPGRLGDRDGVVDATHRDHAHRAARAVHQLDGLRQDVLDAVAVDRVRVPAAHLHELEGLVAGQLGDVSDERSRRGRVAVLVDEAHHPPLPVVMSGRGQRDQLVVVGLAHQLQPFQGALRLGLVDLGHGEADVDEHPVAGGRAASSSSSPMLMIRRTPLTSTRARCSWPVSSSTIWPGIPRHIAVSLPSWRRSSP